MRNSRSALLALTALSALAYAPSQAQAVAPRSSGARPLRSHGEPIYVPPKEVERARGAYTSPNGGRNRKGRTVKADQRRAIKRRNKARHG